MKSKRHPKRIPGENIAAPVPSHGESALLSVGNFYRDQGGMLDCKAWPQLLCIACLIRKAANDSVDQLQKRARAVTIIDRPSYRRPLMEWLHQLIDQLLSNKSR